MHPLALTTVGVAAVVALSLGVTTPVEAVPTPPAGVAVIGPATTAAPATP